jgi:hypothetical protein
MFFSRKVRWMVANFAVKSGQTSGQLVKMKVASTILPRAFAERKDLPF